MAEHIRGRQSRPSMRWLRVCLMCFTCLLNWLCALPSSAQAAPTPAVTLSASVGINGYYDTDHLVPVAVTIRNKGPATKAALEVSTSHPGLGSNQFIDGDLSYPLSLPARSTIHKEIAVPGSFVGQAVLRCEVNGLTTASTPISGNLLGKVALVAVVSKHAQAAQFLTGSAAGTGGEPIMAEHIPPTDVPSQAGLLDNLTAVTMTPDMLKALSANQKNALNTWVTLGGLLLITGTSPQAAVGKLALPLQSGLSKKVSAVAMVNAIGDAAKPLPGPVVANGKLTSSHAVVLVGPQKTPLIASLQEGRGTVIQTAFSPTKILGWGGSTALWTQVIGAGLSAAKPVFPHFNGSDGVYTLTNASDSLSPLRVPSLKFWGSIFFLYVLAIGPVLFYFLRTSRKEPWGWLILPVVSIVTTAAIYGFGVSQRPNGLLAEGVGVLELTGTGEAASYGMTGFTSPFVTNATAQAGAVQFALPLAGSSDKGIGHAQSVMGTNTNVDFRKVPRWGLRYVYTSGTVPNQGELDTDLEETFGFITGSVTNNTPYAIHDAALIWRGNMYQLGDLNPGDTVWLDNETTKRSFKQTWLPTYGRYNGDITHGLGRVLGSYLAEQPERSLLNSEAVLVGTTSADTSAGLNTSTGSNTPSTVDLSTKQKLVSRQDVVFVRQFTDVTLTSLKDKQPLTKSGQLPGEVTP